MNKIKAHIEGVPKHGLWVIVEHSDNKDENTMMAITEEELLPIRDAIDDYMLFGHIKP